MSREREAGQTFGAGSLVAILRGAALAGLLQVASYGLSYVLNFLLAHWLGAAQFGRYAYTMTVYSLVGLVATAGFSASALRFLPQYLAHQDSGNVRRYLATARRTLLGVATAIALMLLTLLWTIPGSFGAYADPLLYGLPLVVLLAVVQFASESLRAFGSVFQAYFPSQVLRPLLVLAAVWVALRTTGGVDAPHVVLTVVGVMLVVAAVQLISLARAPGLVPAGEAAPSVERSLWWKISLSLLAISVLGALLRQMDVVILGWFVPTSEVGIYAIAVRLATFCGLSLILINILAAPSLLTLYSAGRKDEMQALASQLAHVVFWPALAVALLGGYFARDILGLLRPEYRAAAPAMIVLLLGQLVNVAVGPVGHLVDLTGHHRAGLYVRAFALALGVVAALSLIPRFGIIGAALATAAAMVVWNVSLYVIVATRVGLRTSIFDAVFAAVRGRGTRGT